VTSLLLLWLCSRFSIVSTSTKALLVAGLYDLCTCGQEHSLFGKQTLPQPPYTIGYSGALFREYPGPWQVMFKQQNGVYACVAERKERYGLGEFKEELMEQLGLNTEEKGSALEFLRKGYKVHLRPGLPRGRAHVCLGRSVGNLAGNPCGGVWCL